jgi:hypothetical protein
MKAALFSALLPCLVLARTTLVSREAKQLLEMQDMKEMKEMREKRETDSEDNAAVLFNLNPIDNMLSTEEARGAKAASVELDQLEQLAKVVEEEEEPRLEKSLLNTFPFNQHHDGDHHGDHGSHGEHHGHHGDHGDHGERHGEHGGHHSSEYSLDRSASSAPLRDRQGSASGPLRNRLSNRVKDVVANQVREQLGQPGFGFRETASNSFHSRQGQSGSSFPFGSVANKFRNEEEEEQDGDLGGLESGADLDETDVSFNIIGQAAAQDEEVKGGRKCIDKVMMVRLQNTTM